MDSLTLSSYLNLIVLFVAIQILFDSDYSIIVKISLLINAIGNIVSTRYEYKLIEKEKRLNELIAENEQFKQKIINRASNA